MKEAVGGVSLFNIVIVFIVLFTGYVCLSINYSKAYGIKNELLTIIRNQGGVCSSDSGICSNFKDVVANYLKDVGYRSTRACDDDWVGFNREGERDDKNAAFCVLGVKDSSNSQLPNSVYYKVKVFYQLDIPFLSGVFRFSVEGETSKVYSPNECSNDTGYPWC